MNTVMTRESRFAKEDRVRARTRSAINEKIDSDLEKRIRFYAAQDKDTISERIEELDREWDIERILQMNAASLGLAGVVFGITLSRKWLVLPLIVSGFLLRHAIQGWCPPVPLLRRNGVRTRMEIEQERYALKILRGDFDNIERRKGEEVPDVTQVVHGVRV
jgi:hypothetical protein